MPGIRDTDKETREFNFADQSDFVALQLAWGSLRDLKRRKLLPESVMVGSVAYATSLLLEANEGLLAEATADAAKK